MITEVAIDGCLLTGERGAASTRLAMHDELEGDAMLCIVATKITTPDGIDTSRAVVTRVAIPAPAGVRHHGREPVPSNGRFRSLDSRRNRDMQRTRLLPLAASIALLLLGSPGGAAQDAPPPAAPPELKPLAFLANGCWEGPLPEFVGRSTGYGETTVTHCVRWALEGRVLRDSLLIAGQKPEIRGETTYFWDAARKQLRYVFWSIGPSYSYGTVRVEGNKLIFDDEELYGANGLVRFTSTWTQIAPDKFVQYRQRLNKDGAWTKAPDSTFVRKPLR